MHGFVELLDQGDEAHAESLRDLSKLDEIEPALPGLVLRHEALRPIEALGKLTLRQAGVVPRLAKKRRECVLLGGVDGPAHPGSRRSRNGISQKWIKLGIISADISRMAAIRRVPDRPATRPVQRGIS